MKKVSSFAFRDTRMLSFSRSRRALGLFARCSCFFFASRASCSAETGPVCWCSCSLDEDVVAPFTGVS